MADRNTAMINFRLNLSKEEDREIYDYIQQFDSSDFKAVLKGGKSNFIKTVLLSYIRGIKQEQEATKALAEQKAQNEELAKMLGVKIDESQRTLLQALPELVEKVVLGVWEGKVVSGMRIAIEDNESTADSDGIINETRASAEVGINIGALPEVSKKLPDEAFDYFSGL